MARLVRAATDRNPPTLGGGGCQLQLSSSDSPVSEKPPFPPTPMGGRRLSERLVTLPRVPTAPFTSPAPFNVRPVSALHDETMPPFRRWRCAPHYTGGERPLGVGCDALLTSF